MAEVFLAMARGPASFSKLVVLKRLREVADKEEHVAMFLDEARLAARLNHPNIVHTYEVGEIDGQYFIVMEYLEGQPLNRIFKELVLGKAETSPFTTSCVLRVVIDVLMGLQSAHDLKDYDGTLLNVVHRDISPHNIFVTYEGAVKIVDFGIAKAAVNSTKTETGILKGKVAYMAPEQALCSKTLDHRADLYSVGVVLWELLAGKRIAACAKGAACSACAKGAACSACAKGAACAKGSACSGGVANPTGAPLSSGRWVRRFSKSCGTRADLRAAGSRGMGIFAADAGASRSWGASSSRLSQR